MNGKIRWLWVLITMDHFLAGRAALAFTWGDLGGLAQQEGSKVKGKIGSALLPGTSEYYSIVSNKLQLPYLRIPGAYSYWQALDAHLAEAAVGQLSPAAALKATAVDFEEITIRLGRERQRRSYRASLGP